ncbi:MAG: hypothetical protein RL846_15035 [Deltaproteobacteria bacterium]
MCIPRVTFQTQIVYQQLTGDDGEVFQQAVQQLVQILEWIPDPNLESVVSQTLQDELNKVLADPDNEGLAARVEAGEEGALAEALALVDLGVVAATVTMQLVGADAVDPTATCECPPAVPESDLGDANIAVDAGNSNATVGLTRDEMIAELAAIDCSAVDPDWFSMTADELLPIYLTQTYAQTTENLYGDDLTYQIWVDGEETDATTDVGGFVAERLAQMVTSGLIAPETVENLLTSAAAGDPGAAAALYGMSLSGLRGEDFSFETAFNDNQVYGGNCATFVSSAWYHSSLPPFGEWNEGPTERNWGEGYRVYAGSEPFRVATSLYDSMIDNGVGVEVDSVDQLGPGDLVFTSFSDPHTEEHPDWDHVSMIVGFGPNLPPVIADAPPPPLFASVEDANAYWAANADAFSTTYGVDYDPSLLTPYAVDHGGPNPSQVPQPYDNTITQRANGDNEDRTIHFVQVNG